MNKPRVARRVQAVGSYGFGNFGDELFVETVHHHGDSLWPDARLRTFAPTRPTRVYSTNHLVGKAARLATATVGLGWADTIAICGGSVLQDIGGVARLRLAALRWRRVEALGVSIGPFPSKEAEGRVGSFLNHLSRLVVRDRASLDRLPDALGGADPTVGGDLVALNEWLSPTSPTPGLITVCPSAAAGSDVSGLVNKINAAVQRLDGRRPSHRVMMLALSGHDASNDAPICSAVAAGLTELGVNAETQSFAELGVTGTAELLRTSAMVWSQRLHGAVVAYLTEVPFLLEGHHAKCVDFGSDIGAEDLVLSSNDSWAEAAETLSAQSSRPRMEARDYRARARRIYGIHGWGR